MADNTAELEESIVSLQEAVIDVQDHSAAMAREAAAALAEGDWATAGEALNEIIDKFATDPSEGKVDIEALRKKRDDDDDDASDDDDKPKGEMTAMSEQMRVGVALDEGEPAKPIQIFRTGEFNHPRYGKIIIDQKMLGEIASNFKSRVRGQDIPIDLEHKNDQGAVGWIKDVKLEEGALWATPEWSEDAARDIRNKKFRYMSPQFGPWTNPETGAKFDHVLMSAALTNYPFLKEMEPVSLNEIQAWAESDKSDGPPWLKDKDKGDDGEDAEKPAANEDKPADDAGDDDDDGETKMHEERKMDKPVSLAENPEFIALAEQNAVLERKVALMERAERVTRFSEIIDDGNWVGDRDSHVSFMESLADKFGEDSEEFKFHVAQQNATAKVITSSPMFSERGTRGSGVTVAGDEAIKTAARELVASGQVKNFSEGVEMAIQNDPALYEAYDRAHKQRVRRATGGE